MDNKLQQFLEMVSGNVVVCNYLGNNAEITKVFEELEYEYNEMSECFDLCNVEDENYSFKIRSRELENIHIDADGLFLEFKNGDRVEIICEL